MLKIIGKVAEEIMLQCLGNALQQGNVDIVFAENLMHVGASAANVLSQLRGRRALLPHHLFDMLPDMHKKRGGFPRPHNNKLFHAKKLAFLNGFLLCCLKKRRCGKFGSRIRFEMLWFYMSICPFVVSISRLLLRVNGAKVGIYLEFGTMIGETFGNFE